MKRSLEDKLFRDFPDLFPNGRDADIRRSLMCFGIETEDGWFDLIYSLCKDISNIIRKEENKKIREEFQVVQVKQKFGQLRYYTSCGIKEIFDAIYEAEHKSYTICELCGKKGRLTVRFGYYQTLCERCMKKKGATLVETYQTRRLDSCNIRGKGQSELVPQTNISQYK